jgi:hypothetical protein
MNVTTMIDAAVATLEEKDQPRMRAAMRIGARFALEAAIGEGGYLLDVKKALADLDGQPQSPPTITPVALGALEPAL